MRKRRRGQTSFEVLVPIVIIGILAGISLPAIMSAKYKAKRAHARATIKTLALQLEAYRDQEGSYPPSKGGSAGDPRALVIYLDGIYQNGGPSTPYFDFKRSEVDNQNRFLDRWGGFYYYRNLTQEEARSPGSEKRHLETENRPSFQIWTQAGEADSKKWILYPPITR
ncbi:MAG: type II secretion system protein [Planctomycetota bacterium]|nr:type II secretion system protein [Planctomycetota bacterium]